MIQHIDKATPRRRRLRFRYRHPRIAAVLDRIDWFAVFLIVAMLAIGSSPTPAGMLARAAISVPFAHAGLISHDAYMQFGLHAHW
jgi:hypothetical protein